MWLPDIACVRNILLEDQNLRTTHNIHEVTDFHGSFLTIGSFAWENLRQVN